LYLSDKKQELKFNQPQAPAQIDNPKEFCKFQVDQSPGQGPKKWKRHWLGWFKTFWLCKQSLRLNLSLITFLIGYVPMKELNEGDLGQKQVNW